MMWLYIGLGTSIAISITLGIYVFSEIKKLYEAKGIFSNRLLFSWYAMWAFHHIPVVLASLFSIWLIPINNTFALIGGLIIFIIGLILLLMGMIEFRFLHRSTGQDVSNLIISGIYLWSRNPQFVGWVLMLLGISIAGQSGFALFLTVMFMIILHLYTILLEEPYLERLYEEEYCQYKSNSPRYIGIPKNFGSSRVGGG
ncbi:MAG: DUF1295 domain-containing protein [Kiritimatiellaeota bacterium]|nr:DUF1295 domain-containing protein [Kiritimatiellota bacterium]